MMKQTFSVLKKINYLTETPEKQQLIDKVCKFTKEQMLMRGFTYTESHNPDYIFSIGGDGTMLNTMHNTVKTDATIIGVNAGNVGFLTPYTLEDVFTETLFNDILNNQYRVEKRSVLNGLFHKNDCLAVNEFAIMAPRPEGMIKFSMEIIQQQHNSLAGTYKANSVLLSGPCGSTAYNMNAGGAIVDPSVKVMQLLMVAPMLLGVRPLIFGTNTKVRLTLHSDALVCVDGIVYGSTLHNNDQITMSLVKEEVNLIVPNNWNFYDVLSKKLHWNNGQNVNLS